jgi:lysozyme
MPAPVPTKSANKAGTLAGIVGLAAAAALLVLTPKEEGTKQTTYRDIASVLTYCTGATENAQWGKTYTLAECSAQLDRDLARHAAGVAACLPMDRLTLGQRIAFVDTAYNIGVAGFCNSTMARLALQGDVVGSCSALYAWNQARINGTLRPVKGLILRRMRSIEICLTKV